MGATRISAALSAGLMALLLLIAAPAVFAPVHAQQPNTPMAIGLAEITDWSVQQPFLDVMKTARPWIGHKPGQWGGMDVDDLAGLGILDDAGWPRSIPRTLSSIGTVILTDLPEQAVSLRGRYRLTFTGNGIVEVAGRAQKVRYGKGEVSFDYTPGPGAVDIRIQRSDPARKGDYVRDIKVVKLDNIDAYNNGAIFNPDWLARMRGFSALRFMDWMDTNNSRQSAWDDRPKVTDYTWARKGVPLEIMQALTTDLGADAWFNMPHLADDDYIARFADMVRTSLPPERKVYVEFSNEVWNGRFAQARWATSAAVQRWGDADAGGQYYGMRAAEVAGIWSQEFQDDPARLVNVISTQTDWLGREVEILSAPRWVGEGNPPPAEAFQAYAITGYFGGILGTKARAPMVRGWIADSLQAAQQAAMTQGLTGDARAAFVEQHKYDLATTQADLELRAGTLSGDDTGTLAQLLGKYLTYHAAIARDNGLELIMYEGGSHVVGIGDMVDAADLTAFFTHLNYTPEMGAIYNDLIRGWYASGGRLFNAYADLGRPGKWGSWGALRYLSDENPRWDAIVQSR